MQLLKMAFRDLGRNRRRSFFSALAVSVGLAILILMASVIQGEMGSAIEKAILLAERPYPGAGSQLRRE